MQYKIINQWNGGFQGEVQVTNTVGFTGVWNGVNTAPASLTLDDAGCALS
ncbi:hypothetical protein [Nonomuraea polychroma]|nr:hypothetical protein [Nonomuraea polychroma]